jgi:translation elongation factor EF-G
MEQERERGITITSAAVTCFWTQKHDEGIFKSRAGIAAPDQHHRYPRTRRLHG